MRRAFVVTVVVGLLLVFAIREYRSHERSPVEEAYIGTAGATVWNTTGQIRQPIANLTYGQPVQVYQRDADNVLVSTAAGVRGWVSSVALMDPDLWRHALVLAESTKIMPVQAVGHTRGRANIHTEPGRDSPVIVQARGDAPLVVLQHADVTGPVSLNGKPSAHPISEGWWLVRANVAQVGTVSGWALGRLVAFDLPEPLSGYQSSEGMTIVAWFEINRAKDASSDSERPEYLIAGMRGPQDGCDFTLTRVYTWSPKRRQYETAFMDSHLCGKLPVTVTPAKVPGGDAYFRFRNMGVDGVENRAYHMNLTVVRRMDAGANAKKRKRAAGEPKEEP